MEISSGDKGKEFGGDTEGAGDFLVGRRSQSSHRSQKNLTCTSKNTHIICCQWLRWLLL
jgi:hypothetical protein